MNICGVCRQPTNGKEWVSGDGHVYHSDDEFCLKALRELHNKLAFSLGRVYACQSQGKGLCNECKKTVEDAIKALNGETS